METEDHSKYEKCGFCRYFVPWGKYGEGASAADVRRGKCHRYPPRVDLAFYPYFLKHVMHIMESVAQVEHSNEPWPDHETSSEEIVRTCSILPYVQMDDFCGEYRPAHIDQIKSIINLFISHDIHVDEFQEGLKHFEKLVPKNSKRGRFF